MTHETWKDCVGFEGRYQVSDLGRVRSMDCSVRGRARGATEDHFRRVKGRILKPAPQASGHLTVVLGKGNTRSVHTLVMRAFKGEPPPGHEVRHVDGTPGHNWLTNLIYGTRGENNRDKILHGRTTLSVEQVQRIRAVAAEGVRGAKRALAKEFGVTEVMISAVIHGRLHTHV